MKTPEQYFVDDVRLPDVDDAGRALTSAEQAFLDKYLGAEREKVLAQAARLDPRSEDVVSGIVGTESGGSAEEHSDEKMRSQLEIRLVSFSLLEREYALPITVIQEVIRYVKPTKLPTAPACIAGIINLRGRVTPLVSLRTLLGIPGEQEDRFIVVCRHRGLQIGLMIGAVSTMYKALAWGSRSMTSTRLFNRARAAARFSAVVVLPTPPFWFAMAMTLVLKKSPEPLAVRTRSPAHQASFLYIMAPG